MWSRSIASKLLRSTSPRGGFVADFPSSEATVLQKSASEPAVFPAGKLSGDDHLHGTLKIFVSTWNVGGVVPADGDAGGVLEDWLDTENTYDIYVLGFQETVPLSTRNVLGPERKGPSARWNSLIRAALNSSDAEDGNGKVGEKQKIHPVKHGGGGGGGGAPGKHRIGEFRCVMSRQMVGILVSIWVRSDIRRHVRHPAAAAVGCGVMGFLGNKGSVSVRFLLHATSFCFVCCHLASGGKEGDELLRNSNAGEILSRTSFPGGPSLDLPRKIMDHDRVILLGDLNYRISLSDVRTRSLVERKEWRTLLKRDQLTAEICREGVFGGWREGEIRFSPTYKYYPNSDEYYGACAPGRKGDKRRAPAWCDRILWYGRGLNQTRYDRGESRLSDHRPVRAIFTAEVDVSKDLRSPECFFLSERDDIIEETPPSPVSLGGAAHKAHPACRWEGATCPPPVRGHVTPRSDVAGSRGALLLAATEARLKTT